MIDTTKGVRRTSVLLLSSLIAGACGGGDGSTGPSVASVAAVTIAPTSLSLESDETATLRAATLDAAGHALTGRTVAWSSSAPQVARVSDVGVVTGVAPGTATIKARSEGIEGSAGVIVSVRSEVSPATRTIEVGDGTQLNAMRADTVLTNVSWSTSNASVATVSSTGYVSALAVGSATITASIGSRYTRTAAVAVVEASVASVTLDLGAATLLPGATQQLAATLRDSRGNVLTGRDVSWTSSSAAVTVSPAGLVTGVSIGVATITATSAGKSASAVITVADPWVIEPAARTIAVGDGAQLLAVRNGIALGDASWSTSNASVATVSGTGFVTAVSVGEATITASRPPSQTRTATVTVVAQPVATVRVEPNAATISRGGTQQFTAVLEDHLGRDLTGRAVVWTSSNTDVATVSPEGLVTAVAPGTATIRAESEGKSGSATLTVRAPDDVVASVTIAPHETTIEVGDYLTLAARLENAAGEVISGKGATWTSLDPAIAEMFGSTTGQLAGRSPGTARIVASAEGKADTATVVVTPAVVTRVEVTGGVPSLPAYGTGCAPDNLSDDIKYAYAYNAHGTLITGRPITWVVGPPGVLTRTTGNVPPNGVQITAVGVGTGRVEATIDRVTGFTTVAVYSCTH